MSSLQDYIGNTEEELDFLAPAPANALRGVLDSHRSVFSVGDPLPPQWHWLYFLPKTPQREMGADGHPKVGGFLPDTGLPRRMFAGARVTYKKPLILGHPARRQSQIISIDEKKGKSGRLAFVTVAHEYLQNSQLALTEEQTIVYREAATEPVKTTVSRKRKTSLPSLDSKAEITPNTVMLFRYSALTFNAHRIHYDRDYAVNEEFYPDLVVHGPLTAIMLLELFHKENIDQKITFYEFRGSAPFFVNRPMTLGIAHDSNHGLQWDLTAFDDKGVAGHTAKVQTQSGL